MSEPITVRLCEVGDLPQLAQREPHPAANYAANHFSRQQKGNYFFAVAWRGDEPLGTSVLDCRPGKLQPELKSLWVYPNARRQGAARALTRFLESEALRQEFTEVFLRVDPANEAAIPMYISLDYTPTGDHRTTTYEYVDETGQRRTREQIDAVYRKSLRLA
ncbi:MAG: GNAT family N-acetyltransferase [Micropruina sp.]|nr:MAG: GNAT family N-acetyltransferase [Micropruina sp.]